MRVGNWDALILSPAIYSNHDSGDLLTFSCAICFLILLIDYLVGGGERVGRVGRLVY